MRSHAGERSESPPPALPAVYVDQGHYEAFRVGFEAGRRDIPAPDDDSLLHMIFITLATDGALRKCAIWERSRATHRAQTMIGRP